MNDNFSRILIPALLSFSLSVLAEDTTATTSAAAMQAQMNAMQEQMQTMQQQMTAIQNAGTPEERRAAMQAHMATMQAHMQSMHQMGGCIDGDNCTGGMKGAHMQGDSMMGDCMGMHDGSTH